MKALTRFLKFWLSVLASMPETVCEKWMHVPPKNVFPFFQLFYLTDVNNFAKFFQKPILIFSA